MGKQMEGDNEQRRRRAAEAREAGKTPSEEGVTTGASGQSRSVPTSADHAERIAGPGWGKAQPDRVTADPRPGSVPSAREEPTGQTDALPPRSGNQGAEPGRLGEDDQRVFEALARIETEDDAPTASAIADGAGLSTEVTVPALQRLMDDHDVVQQLPADAEAGHRYRVKAR